MIDGEQLTIQFYVGDFLATSHKDKKILGNILNNLRREFRQEDELTKTRGLIHEYLLEV